MVQMRKRIYYAIISLALFAPGSAMASSIEATGQIARVYASYGGQYFGFRVFVKQNGADQLTACSEHFAYINTGDANYQVKVDTLLTIYQMGRDAYLYISKDDSSGYCYITDVSSSSA